MAQTTLAVLSSPDFPQVLKGAIDRAFDRVLSQSTQKSFCEYELPEFGGEKCARVAIVHHLEANLDCCRKHFEAVNRGN